MLDSLRAFSKTWIAKILLAVLVVSFAAFGINNVITDLGGSTVARVGNEDISIREFQRGYQAQMNAVAQQLGTVPTADQAMALGIPSAVISRLASETALNKLGQDLGLGVSDQRLGQMVRSDPSFAGTLGNFTRENFTQILQQSGYTEAEYFEVQRAAARRQQLAIAMFGDAAIPETAQQLVHRYSDDKRTVDYFVLNATSIPPVAAPTEEELAAYLKEHQAEYRTVEARTADVLVFSFDTLAATKTFSDEEIAAEYERTRANYTTIERRAIRQVVLPDAAAVTAFETGLAQGRSFGELAMAAGLTPTDLGTLSQAEINDVALAEAAFGVEKGKFVIIDGATGKRAVAVAAVFPGGQRPLEDVREEVVRSLGLTAARQEYTDILDQIEELRASFQPLTAIAERYGLPVASVELTNGGAELEQVPAIPEENRGKVAQAVFAGEQGKLAPAVVISANNHVWFDLKAVEPARDQTLDEVRDAITEALTAERTDAALTAKVEEIVGKLEAGTPFPDVAAAESQFPQLSQPFTRAGDPSSPVDQTVASAAFAGGPGHFGSAVNGAGDRVVFQVVEITPATEAASDQTREVVAGSARDDLYNEFVAAVRDDMGLRINQQALNQLLAVGPVGN